MNDEHVIPKSLGGFRSTVIRASKHLNSAFATKIDARVANDSMIMFGRREAGTKGHSGKRPVARIKGARAWQEGQPFDEGERRYTIEIPGNGSSPRVWDQRTGTFLHSSVFNDTGFIIPNWKMDHVARFKFTVKTLLGVGWKLLDLTCSTLSIVTSFVRPYLLMWNLDVRHQPKARSPILILSLLLLDQKKAGS